MGLLNENIAQTISDFNNIKSKIIENGVEVPDGTKTSEYADKIDEVSEKANSEGYNIGKEEGVQTEYDRFWDIYQNYGNRANYNLMFGGNGWNNETFKPKYDIKPTSAYAMFWYNAALQGDIAELFENLGIVLDFSNLTDTAQYVFANMSKITRLPVLDFSKCPNISQAFMSDSKLVTIDKLIIKADGTTGTNTYAFSGCSALENIIIEGVIGTNNWSFSSCKKLTHDSLMSIINALKNYSGTTTARTLTLGTTNLEKLTDDEKAIATEKGWTLA